MYYILDEKNKPKKVEKILPWVAWIKDNKDHLIFSERLEGSDGEEILVSTIFTGLDIENFRYDYKGLRCAPYLWETMILGGKYDRWQKKWCTYEDSVDGHAKAIKMAKRAL